jgi:CheY-like chemotaxis protein
MSLLLKEWGYHVASCKNQQDAWLKLKTFTPSLIISDYHFPNEKSNGLELIKKIRQKTDTTTPALLITADTDNIEKQLKEDYTEKEINMTQITMKPILPAKLKLTIQYFIIED